jgi:hypothetical protein
MASRRRFELPVSRMKSWRPGPLDERDIETFLSGRAGIILIILVATNPYSSKLKKHQKNYKTLGLNR